MEYKYSESKFTESEFVFTLPNAPESIDVKGISEDQIHAKMQRGYESYKVGRKHNATEVFSGFRVSHS